MGRPNLNELANTVAAINEANGWTFDLNNRPEVALKVALVASEGAEACEEHEAGAMARIFKAQWVHAVQVELADVAIRIFHFLEKLGVDAEAVYLSAKEEDLPRGQPSLLELARFEAQIMRHIIRPAFRIFEELRKPNPISELGPGITPELARLVVSCEVLCAGLDPAVTLWDIIDQKLEKNRGRGYRHGHRAF